MVLDRSAAPIRPAATAIRPRFRLASGTVGVDSRAAWLRTVVGVGLWLGPAVLLARGLGRVDAQRAQHAIERHCARDVRRHLGIDLDAAGLEHVDPGTDYVIASLHEGFADVLALLSLPLDLRFVARDELFDWRFLGGYLRDTGQIVTRPELGQASLRALLRDTPRLVSSRESLVVFAQGSILGIETDFGIGAFALARAMRRPILPVAVTGSHRVWEYPFSPRLRYSERVSLRVLPPIPAHVCLEAPPDDIRRHVRDQLKTIALAGDVAPPRRYVPSRDGYWDGYTVRIDPRFPALAADVARHRAQFR